MEKVKKIIEVIKALMEKNPRVISRSEATRNLSYAFMLQDFSPSFTGLVASGRNDKLLMIGMTVEGTKAQN
ncbi:MAG: hypothetical protein STSR0002_08650 [Smithella sp.]